VKIKVELLYVGDSGQVFAKLKFKIHKVRLK